jgi:DNA (cytosine-5)-methyltransferase 1
MKFVDLFAGLAASIWPYLNSGTSVFACDISEGLRDLYQINFGMRPVGDIRDFPMEGVPSTTSSVGFRASPSLKLVPNSVLATPKMGTFSNTLFKFCSIANLDLCSLRTCRTWKSIGMARRGLNYLRL